MNSSSGRLLFTLRGTCRTVAWGLLIAAIFTIIEGFLIAPFALTTPGKHAGETIYQSEFSVPNIHPALIYKGVPGGQISIRHFRADVTIEQADLHSPLLRFVRWKALLNALLLGAFALIFDRLYVIFKYATQGEVFTLSNVREIRFVGWTILGYNFFYEIGHTILDYIISEHLASHVEFHEVFTDFLWDASGSPGFNLGVGHLHITVSITGIIFGLCMLALAEAFRYGLLLREENDLTV